MMIVFHIDLNLQIDLKIDVISILNKYIDQMIEINAETIQISQTEQKRDVYENDVKDDAIDRCDQID